MDEHSPQRDAADIIDHVTHFRLGLAAHHLPPQGDRAWWSVLIELEGVSIDRLDTRLAPFKGNVVIPSAYGPDERRRTPARQLVTLFARGRVIDWLNDRRNHFGIAGVRLGASVPEQFLDLHAEPQTFETILVREGTVLQAVIDEGIAIAHDLFRSGQVSSRVHYAHIFETEPHPCGRASIGRALRGAEIDALLRDCTFDGVLDEDLFYRRSGQFDPVQDVFSSVALRRSHGTHVMALAAGAPMADAPPDCPILCASLPSRMVADTTGYDMLPILVLAFQTLAMQARRYCTAPGKPVPVVFTFSYGNNGGPHDGTEILARLFDQAFGAVEEEPARPPQKSWLSLPAGNANLSRLHAMAHAQGRTRLNLALSPDDQTPSHVQFWLPSGSETTDPTSVSVRPPGADCSVRIEARRGGQLALDDACGARIGWLACQYVEGDTHRLLVTLSINPTASLVTGTGLAPAGLWRIEIDRPEGSLPGELHAWVLRDETLPGQLPGGRQAFFDDPGYVRFDRYGAPLAVDPEGTSCPVLRSGSISGFACAASPLVVAAYTGQEAVLSDYSAAGPLNPSPRGDPREGPDLAARGDDSFVLRGVYSAGSRSGSRVRMSGTSVAAPQVAALAAQGIGSSDGSARDWAVRVAETHRFRLDGDPAPTRAGLGGVTGRRHGRAGET